MNPDLDVTTRTMLRIAIVSMGKPKNHSGKVITAPHATSKPKPNRQKISRLRIRMRMPATNPKGNETAPTIHVAR